ncbi:MAG: iron ABC transporter permease [Acidobacteriota bacterium]|nr:iron ABC transporter permease [Acidobacteriota bacterium]
MRWLTYAAGLVVATFVSAPLFYLVMRAMALGPYRVLEFWWRHGQVQLLMQTVALMVGVVAIANAIAIPAAWLVARTDLRYRGIWATILALPLVIPSYVSAFSWVSVLGPRGLLQGMVSFLGVERLPAIAYGYTGALFALALFTYPYLFLPLVAAMNSLDGSTEESSRVLGIGPWRTFFRVTLPQLRGSIATGSLLIALYALSDFGAVSIVRYNTLTLGVYNAYRSLFDRSGAALAGLQLAVVALAVVGLHGLVRRRERRSTTGSQRTRSVIELGRWRILARIGLSCVVVLNIGIPLLAISAWLTRSGLPQSTRGLMSATLNSFTVSSLAAIAAVVLAFPVALWVTRSPGFVGRWVERLSITGFAMPGLVVALSLVFVATRQLPWMYQTTLLVVIAYVIRFLPESLGATRNALLQFSPHYEEAARNLGHGAISTFRSVTWPLIRPGVLAGGALVFMTAMKELPATLILRPIGFETLATTIWSAASESYYADAALPALCLLFVGAVPVYRFSIQPTLRVP